MFPINAAYNYNSVLKQPHHTRKSPGILKRETAMKPGFPRYAIVQSISGPKCVGTTSALLT